MLEAVGVSVSYGERVVFRDVHLELERGEDVALIGRSGSGKTSLMLVLAGLVEPTQGRVTTSLDGRQITYVPQAPSLLPELTAVQNASLGLRIRGVAAPEAERAARVQLRALGLAESEDALPHELSGGMQQRVSLARAMAFAPEVLLADEPTGALDHATAAIVVDRLRAFARDHQATLVVATHDEALASSFSRQVDLGGAS